VRATKRNEGNPAQRILAEVDHLIKIAQQRLRAGRPAEAETAYRQILAIKPNFAEVHNDLGNVLCDQERFDEAQPHYERAIALRPDLFEAHSNLGNIFSHQQNFCQAAAQFQQALLLKPNNPGAHNELGKVLKDQGQLDQALASFDRALALNPDLAEAHYNRATLKTFGRGDADLAALEALAARGDRLPSGKMIYVHFALGKALDDAGEHDRAFQQWLLGGSLKRKELIHDESSNRQLFERVAQVFDAKLLERSSVVGNSPAAPIFILGMPRSGSTLVEQILASHPQVHAGGELQNLARVAFAAYDANGQAIVYPEYVPRLGPDSLGRLGQAYLASLPTLPTGKTWITDKAPGNLFYAGLIRMALPGAKIIHTVRDPIDTCISCFSTLFTNGHQFSYELTELGRYYRQYSNLMDHWRSVLPAGAMLDVVYENVVDNLEEQARRLVEYCGLPWDDRCLSFHETSRPITTASSVQVRRPLYRNSLARWRRYESHLGPLLAELAGLRRSG
jgi:Tfp pilus assembly protein PilF